jgi:Ala-tRNA(Pro) deacylase
MLHTPEQLLAYLDTNAIPYTHYTHPRLFTCEQAKDIVGELNMPGTGIKNLFLKDSKKNIYLISATYDTQVDLKTTGKTLNAKELRFADANLLMTHLGVEPGSVTPLALMNDPNYQVQMIVDAALLRQDLIQVHPLSNDATVVMKPAHLIRFFELLHIPYRVYDFMNHELKS